ncbi:UNVERIFIED_CONTAM: hypothetical protein FKN15_047471 [Acipenser sinensis]
MAVTRGGGRVGVWTFPLSEWLGGGSWGDCWPYKIMLCCFLRSALLDALDVREVLVEREREPAGRKKRPDREKQGERGAFAQAPSIVEGRIAPINSFVLYKECTRENISRRDFILKLATALQQKHFDQKTAKQQAAAAQPGFTAAPTDTRKRKHTCDRERMNACQQSPSRSVRVRYNRNSVPRAEWFGSSFQGQSKVGHPERAQSHNTRSHHLNAVGDVSVID